MSSYQFGTVVMDPARVSADLAQVEPFGYQDAYPEFVCGSWHTCMLWNATGDGADGRVRDYTGPAQITELGRKLGYVEELMAANFDLSRLRFARLTRLAPGTVVLPHRDYLDLESDMVRIHVPLMTAPEAYASEEEIIYRMGEGQVWFLDATRAHSIGNFSQRNRIHLMLDFHAAEAPSVFTQPHEVLGIPGSAVVPRRPVRPGEHEAFLALADVVDMANLMDIMAMVVRRYFEADLSVGDVFGWLREIGDRSGNQAVADRVRSVEAHVMISR
jgi:L-proline cis-4-hydroxylase